MLYYELKQCDREKAVEYFKSAWNWFDLSLCLCYFAYLPLSFLFPDAELLRLIQCVQILLTAVKAAFYLRIFEGLSSLIHMLISVFIDLKYFTILFLIFVYALSLMLTVLVKG